MCGFAGAVGAGAYPIREDLLRHRGPDAFRRWADDRVIIDHWRLRVLDLSAAADQPMLSEDGSAVVAFNGEIYNDGALRNSLVASGVQFHTTSDTEVVLQLLMREGAAGLRRLRGMFAIAFWNATSRRLLLARDVFGVKPLYYSTAGGVRFASELPALLRIIEEPQTVDGSSLWSFFTFGFIPSPRTAFPGIRKVAPGEILEIDEHGSVISRSFLSKPWIERSASHRENATAVRTALVDSVREQFRADVPVGVFLSGGIDSNVILAAAREAGVNDIRTFTVDFLDPLEGESNDETSDARMSARFFGTTHTEVPVSLGSAEELLSDIDRFGEPFINPTVYLARLLSHETRKHVTVALSGAGGDELFGGYPRYAALRIAPLLGGSIGRTLARTSRAVSHLLRSSTPRAIRRAAWLAGSMDAGLERAYAEWTYYFTENEKRALLPRLAPPSVDSLNEFSASFQAGLRCGGRIVGGIFADLDFFLPDNILAYTDIGSMAESLEVRVPFLDPDVAYLAVQSLRPSDVGFRRPKRGLRRLFASALPPHVLRGRKRGFNPPLARWMRDSLDVLFDSDETSAFRRDYIDGDELMRMRDAHRKGIEDYSHELFAVLVAARWYKRTLARAA